ncbi:MAG: restriction endonuclease [Candidatus Coatesbacteria bacterium]|nr:restriction endonuclease [Candidatus Coatesbacteria bacterium]
MTVWVVRAGKYGELESIALNKNIVLIGWGLKSLSSFKDMKEIKEMLASKYADKSKNSISTIASELWSFAHDIKKGELIVLPRKTNSTIAVGEVIGDYEYRSELEYSHTIPVKWLKTDIPRAHFDPDLLFSFGSLLTVFKVNRENAEERIKALISNTKPNISDDNSDYSADIKQNSEDQILKISDDNSDYFTNIKQYSKDRILTYILRKYKGHKLEKLIEEILKSEGYFTQGSNIGADEGVDILAGSGQFGFSHPNLCIQVKSGNNQVDLATFRSLQGTMKTFNAEHGLLVSLFGFSSAVKKEAKKSFFKIRLWELNDIFEAVLKNYEKFSEDLKTELPLQRIWILSEKEEEI